MKRLLLIFAAFLGTAPAVEGAEAAPLRGDRPFKAVYLAKNVAWLIASVAVVKFTSKQLERDRKAREIELLKKNVMEAYEDSVRTTNERWQKEAKRQMSLNMIGVREPSDEEIRNAVAYERQMANEDRVLADKWREQEAERFTQEELASLEQGEQPESIDESGGQLSEELASHPVVPVVAEQPREGDATEEIEAVFEEPSHELEVASEETSDQEVAEPAGQEALAQEALKKEEKLKPLSTWKRYLYKGIRAAAWGMIVVQVVGLCSNVAGWWRGKAYNPPVYDRLVRDKETFDSERMAYDRSSRRMFDGRLFVGTALDEKNDAVETPLQLDSSIRINEITRDTRNAMITAQRRAWMIAEVSKLVSVLGLKAPEVNECIESATQLQPMMDDVLRAHRDGSVAGVLRKYLGLPYFGALFTSAREWRKHYQDIESTKLLEVVASLQRQARA